MSVATRRKVVVLAAVSIVVLGIAALLGWFGGDGKLSPEEQAAARRKDATVTEADNGGEVTVTLDTPFILDLEGSVAAPWGLPQANTDALARVSTSLDPDGSAAATFVPVDAFSGATIVAERVPACRAASPPCATPTERFEVTIRVAKQSGRAGPGVG